MKSRELLPNRIRVKRPKGSTPKEDPFPNWEDRLTKTVTLNRQPPCSRSCGGQCQLSDRRQRLLRRGPTPRPGRSESTGPVGSDTTSNSYTKNSFRRKRRREEHPADTEVPSVHRLTWELLETSKPGNEQAKQRQGCLILNSI